MRLPVVLTLRPSRTLAAALLLAHGLAAAETANLQPTVAAPLATLILLSLAANLRRHVYRLPIMALTLRADGTMEAEGRDSCGVVDVDSQTTVLPWLVVLLLRSGKRRIPLVLLPDALGREAHRQLRLWLRWKAKTGVATTA